MFAIVLEQFILISQVFIHLSLIIYVYYSIYDINGRAPIDDFGLLWLIILFFYSSFPVIIFIIQGYEYLTPLSGRLFNLQPDISDNISLMNIVLAYGFGLCSIYVPIRKKIEPFKMRTKNRISYSIMASSIAIIIFSKLIIFVIYNSGLIEKPVTYADQYRVLAEAPVALAQLIKLFSSYARISEIVIVVGLLQRWPNTKRWLIFYVILRVFVFDPEGSRADLVTSFFLLLISWHIIIKPISARKWIFGGITGLFFFIVLGNFREIDKKEDLILVQDGGVGIGEFESVWANSVDLLQMKNKGELDVPFTVSFSEFWGFIPSQLLPFEKLSLSEWYVRTFYNDFKNVGGAWAFGAIGQAAMGGGIVEGAIRGMVIAFLLAFLMRWCCSKNAPWWSLPLMLYMIITLYNSIRDTTFTHISILIQIIFPVLFTIWLGSLFFKDGLFKNKLSTYRS